jgi:hypothetical protein
MNSKILGVLGIIIVGLIVYFLIFNVPAIEVSFNELNAITEQNSFSLNAMNFEKEMNLNELNQFEEELIDFRKQLSASNSNEKTELNALNNILLEKVEFRKIILKLELKQKEINELTDACSEQAMQKYSELNELNELLLTSIEKQNQFIQKMQEFTSFNELNLQLLNKESYNSQIQEQKELSELIIKLCNTEPTPIEELI